MNNIHSELEKMNQLIFALKNWQSFDEPAIAGKLKAFEKIPRAEWSKFRADQLSEQEAGQSLVHIGQKYHNNPKILRDVISALGNMVERYGLTPSDEVYNLLLEHCQNTKVGYYVALFITKFPQFEVYERKWDYLMSIGNIAPKKKSLDIFFREIKQRKQDIPEAYRETIIRFFNDHMNDESLSEYSRNKYKALITQIESIN